ncbi:hypothetical protein BH10ACI1_BH10ACI1_23290 [soil metagenome]
MTREQWQKVDEILQAVLEIKPEKRRGFLDEKCQTDANLRREIESLLSFQTEVEDFIEEPAVSVVSETFLAFSEENLENLRIGNYKILREIGRGGMGAVYLAERADAEFEQKVALKIIKRGMDTDAVLSHFRRERQILAELNHPNIASLLDGGTTADGLPYFVMEYVEGLPLTAFCAANNLNENARLEIFRQVCAAVQYAHQRLVVHRDIKPSNILVSQDETPKLLDFGIAKLLTADVSQTATDFRALTPEYASPEQIRGEKITTATDIYSLGVVLAELLQISKTRDQNPKTDLQAILQTAMREEAELRYKSVEQFSEDIRRYLQGLPVLAQTDSFHYRASKFVKRNKVGVAAGASLAFAVIAGIVSTVSQSRRAERQSRIAERECDKAQTEAEKAEKINRFLQEMLGSADPRAKGKDVKVAEVLDLAAQRIETDLAKQPEVKADLQTTIGLTYLSLGLFEKAETHLRSALKIRQRLFKNNSSEIAESLKNLGKLLQAKGDISEAEPLFHDALKIARKTDEDLLVAGILHNLGGLFLLKGKHAEAMEIHREEITIRRAHLGDVHADVAESLKDLAVVLGTVGNLSEAEQLNREALEILRKIYLEEHPDVASAMTTLASAVEHKNPTEAENLFREALSMRRKLLGNEHPDVAWTLYNYAFLLYNKRDFAAAIKLTDEILAMRSRILTDEHILINSTLQLNGLCLMEQGELSAAEDFLRECFQLRQKTMPPDHWLIASAKSVLGECLARQKRFGEAEELLSESYEKLKEILGENHEQTQKALRRTTIFIKKEAN